MQNPSPVLTGILDELWIARQRLPKESGRLARPFATGRRRVHGAPDMANPAGDTPRMKAMGQVILGGAQASNGWHGRKSPSHRGVNYNRYNYNYNKCRPRRKGRQLA